jgi:transcription elongation factor Elf1
MKLGPALKRAAKAAKKAMGPTRYGVNGKAFVCPCCGYDQFRESVAPMIALHTLVCAQCGHVQFFEKTPPVL